MAESSLLFSVVVPFLNEERRLPACLQALDAQTFSPNRFERMFIDNGSSDASLDIVRSDPRVKLLHESARDPYLARNQGIAAAKGEYVVLLDADCIPAPDWLEKLSEEIKSGVPDVLLGYLAYPPGSSAALVAYEQHYHSKLKYIIGGQKAHHIFGHAGNMVVKTSIFRDIGYFLPMPIVGDTEILHRLLAKRRDADIRYVPAARVVHAEVTTFAHCLWKLFECGGYSETLRRISTFRTLRFSDKLQIHRSCATEHRYRARQSVLLSLILAIGGLSFSLGRAARFLSACAPSERRRKRDLVNKSATATQQT